MGRVNLNRLRRRAKALFLGAALLFAVLGRPHATAAPPAEQDTSRAPTRTLVLVVPGDRIADIARRYGTTSRRILADNPGVDPMRIRPGDALSVRHTLGEPLPPPALTREVRRGIRGRKQVALTFDCGWTRAEDLDRLLATLRRHEVLATFFLTSLLLERVPDAATRIARDGHTLGNHTRTHPHLSRLDDAEVRAQLADVEEAVAEAGHTTRPFWRPPYGDRDDRVRGIAAELGLRSVCWTLDSGDWIKEPPATPDSITRRVCRSLLDGTDDSGRQASALDGAIILFHATASATPEALDRIVPLLRAAGFTLVDLPTLLTP